MTKVLILYYSAYGHMERMAQAVVDGVRDASVEADIKRVPELVPEEVAKRSGFKLDQKAPIATIAELANYDAIIFGSGTRFGVFTSQMRNFLDQTGPLWMKGALVGKVGSVFTGSATQHGGQESTILSMIPTLLHHGMMWSGSPTHFRGRARWTRLVAVRLTAHPRSQNLTAAACPRRTNSPARAFKGATWRGSLANSKHDAGEPEGFRAGAAPSTPWQKATQA